MSTRPTDQDHADAGAHDAADAPVTSPPVTAGELLRQALVDDQDPRFPRWLPLPGIVLGAAWAAYQAAAGDAGLLPTAGVTGAIFAITTVATWLGWQLEID
ncbi:MAG: hypothetical protein WD058_05885 [Dehalococcoidia bacterium]